MRGHEALKNDTPGKRAKAKPPFTEWADVVKGDAVEPQMVLDAAPRRADAPKMELKEAEPAKPSKSKQTGGRTNGTETPRIARMPKAKVRPPTAARKGRGKKLHPLAKLRNGIRRNQRKRGRGR